MGFKIEFEKGSAEQTISALYKLDSKVRRELVKKAIEAVGPILVSKIAEASPVKSGELKRSISFEIRSPNRKTPYAFVGPIYTKAKGEPGRNPGQYAHLTDMGTKKRETKASRNRGMVLATRWFEKTVEANKNKALETMLQILKDGIEK